MIVDNCDRAYIRVAVRATGPDSRGGDDGRACASAVDLARTSDSTVLYTRIGAIAGCDLESRQNPDLDRYEYPTVWLYGREPAVGRVRGGDEPSGSYDGNLSGAQLLATKQAAINSFADLAGKTVGVARGSLTDQGLSADPPKDVRIVRFDDDAAASAAMMAGQVDALGTARPIAAMLMHRFSDRLESKFTIRTAWYSIGLRPGEVDMLQWVNTFIFVHLQNGDLAKIYQKWVGVALPPVPTL